MARRCPLWLHFRWRDTPGRQGSVRPLNFEPIFVDSQSPDFRVKRWSWKPQFGCRTTWPRDTARTFCQGGLNHSLFLPLQRAIESRCRTSELWRLPFEPGLVHAKNVAFAQDHGSLNHVLQFTNVARPAVCLEQFEGFSVDCFELLSSVFPEAINEVLDKQGNVGCAIAQRRHLNRHDIQSV